MNSTRRKGGKRRRGMNRCVGDREIKRKDTLLPLLIDKVCEEGVNFSPGELSFWSPFEKPRETGREGGQGGREGGRFMKKGGGGGEGGKHEEKTNDTEIMKLRCRSLNVIEVRVKLRCGETCAGGGANKH